MRKLFATLAVLLIMLLLALTSLAQDATPLPPDIAATLDAANDQIATQSAIIADLEATITALAPNAEEMDSDEPVFTDLKGDLRRVTTSDFEISIPDSFEGGDLGENLELVLDDLAALGPDFAGIVAAIRQNPDLFRLYAFDSELTNPAFLTNINVTAETPPFSLTIEEYRDASINLLPEAFIIIENDITTLNDFDAMRLVLEWEVAPGVLVKQLQYTIKVNDSFFAVTYSTSADEFEERLPTFEESAATFTPLQ